MIFQGILSSTDTNAGSAQLFVNLDLYFILGQACDLLIAVCGQKDEDQKLKWQESHYN